MREPKINKLTIYVDYTTPEEIVFTKLTKVLGKDVYSYNSVFPAFADKNKTHIHGQSEANSIVRKDIAKKVLNGSSVANIRYTAKNGDNYDIRKSGLVIHNYTDNPDTSQFPNDHFIVKTQFENLSIDNMFKNGKKIHTVWSDIKYSQRKKAYTITWEDKR
jgi:hypothetical protein